MVTELQRASNQTCSSRLNRTYLHFQTTRLPECTRDALCATLQMCVSSGECSYMLPFGCSRVGAQVAHSSAVVELQRMSRQPSSSCPDYAHMKSLGDFSRRRFA